jgi:hypothetical protein
MPPWSSTPQRRAHNHHSYLGTQCSWRCTHAALDSMLWRCTHAILELNMGAGLWDALSQMASMARMGGEAQCCITSESMRAQLWRCAAVVRVGPSNQKTSTSIREGIHHLEREYEEKHVFHQIHQEHDGDPWLQHGGKPILIIPGGAGLGRHQIH